jgi:hypothetical protein
MMKTERGDKCLEGGQRKKGGMKKERGDKERDGK